CARDWDCSGIYCYAGYYFDYW
nr:immunoglobulin heavy chain junction region [Macaca mulatta]MPN72079.1 immunoglobulin heavy chain junction region [Macaca mulatta]MPN72929.1 immunoglobulin heavy chain junction region [Macaca mulatta]MPN74214.1 immunoglobulin heavy chain junction region [Macaca mulatta]MPN74744.1 immunoglobulin heavy chain junction region [Macaca mulatta]